MKCTSWLGIIVCLFVSSCKKPAPSTLGIPAGLVATPNNSVVHLNWQAASSAVSYQVTQTVKINGLAVNKIVCQPSSTTCSDTSVINGTTYTYVVQAKGSDGSLSGNSNSVSAIPLALAPTGLTASQSNNSIHLNWVGNADASSYKVYRSATVNGVVTTIIACQTQASNQVSCDDTSFSNATTYTYVVKATYPGGNESSGSNSVTLLTNASATAVGHGLGPTINQFTASGPVTAVSGQIISGLKITNPNGPCITMSNVTNVTIVNNQIGPCGADATGVGINTYQSDYITIQNNNFNDVASALYAIDTPNGNIVFTNNYTTKVRGPYPRGQMVQLNNVSGTNNRILCNVSDQQLGGYRNSSNTYTGPEDHVSLYKSNGTAASPIEVAYNKIRGGGSPTGGGLMTGDNGGSYENVHHNILINPGQYGIAISGGTFIQMMNNRVYAVQNTWTNIGTYVWAQAGAACSNTTFQGNRVYYIKNTGEQNSYWNGGGCGTVNGEANNTLGDTTLSASMWDEVIPQCQ
jgi:hypothetical protein